jgi:DNA-binding transcriptional regulator YiaG
LTNGIILDIQQQKAYNARKGAEMDVLKARNKAGLSQRKLAIAVGVSLVTIQNWESGITTPKPENMERLKKVLEDK